MAKRKRSDRTEVIKNLQRRGTFTPEERPLVVVTGPLTPSESAEFFARAATTPRTPHSPEQFYAATLNAYELATGCSPPAQLRDLLGELKFKTRAAEHHLNALTAARFADAGWFEAEAFFNQTRSGLEMLARILNCILPSMNESFDGDGRTLANQLRNIARSAPHHQNCVHVADLIDEEETFIATLSAVRSTTFHRYSMPSLALASRGDVHLGGLTLEEFCIQHILFFRGFVKRFLELCIEISADLMGRTSATGREPVRLVAPPFPWESA